MKKIFSSLVANQYYIAFWITLAVAIGLIIFGALMPPRGQVDGSMITSVGLIFLWPVLAFAALALKEGKIAKIKKGDTVITVGEDIDGDNNEESKEE